MSTVHVVAGFPGVGKSTVTNTGKYITHDSDSSKFDKKHFPGNYINHIQKLISIYEADGEDKSVFIFVSTHETVRKALDLHGIKYTLVYPDESSKSEYLQRYKDRKSPQAFIDLLDKHFVEWVGQCAHQTAFRKFRLLPGQYLSDILGFF